MTKISNKKAFRLALIASTLFITQPTLPVTHSTLALGAAGVAGALAAAITGFYAHKHKRAEDAKLIKKITTLTAQLRMLQKEGSPVQEVLATQLQKAIAELATLKRRKKILIGASATSGIIMMAALAALAYQRYPSAHGQTPKSSSEPNRKVEDIVPETLDFSPQSTPVGITLPNPTGESHFSPAPETPTSERTSTETATRSSEPKSSVNVTVPETLNSSPQSTPVDITTPNPISGTRDGESPFSPAPQTPTSERTSPRSPKTPKRDAHTIPLTNLSPTAPLSTTPDSEISRQGTQAAEDATHRNAAATPLPEPPENNWFTKAEQVARREVQNIMDDLSDKINMVREWFPTARRQP